MVHTGRFRPVYQRVGISLIEAHERVGKSVISVVKKASKALH